MKTDTPENPMLHFFKFAFFVWLLGLNKQPRHQPRGLEAMYATTTISRPIFLKHTVRNKHAIQSTWRAARRDVKKSAKLNQPLDRSLGLIDELPDTSKPIVLNFGSASCPPFRYETRNWFNKLVDKHSDKAKFALVYIAEAHPTDAWYIGDINVRVAQHKILPHRRACSEILAEHLDPRVHLILDDMDDSYAKYFGVMYGRLYVIHNGVVVYVGQNGPFGYDMDEVDRFLDSYL